MRTRTLLLPLVPIVVAVAACSGGGSSEPSAAGSPASAPAAAAGPGDPCTLVTPDELTSLFGVAPDPAGPRDENRGSTCEWAVGDEAGANLQLTVWPGSDFFLEQPSATVITGLGDDAYIEPGIVDVVLWRQGDVTAQLLGFGVQDPAEPTLIAVAREIATRLPA